MDRRRARKQDNRRKLLLVVLFFLLVGAAVLVLVQWDRQRDVFPSQGESLRDTIEYEGKTYMLREDVETILVMGLDKFTVADSDAYYNDQQADFLMLLVLDNTHKTATAVHINRDTMTQVNVLGVAGKKIGTVTQQIALSHAYGNGQRVSLHNTAAAVSNLFHGIKVDTSISLTMRAVGFINDAVGGVPVEVLGDFSGIDDTLVQGETVTLTGRQALTYIRAREGLADDSNLFRMERQRQYLTGLYEKIVENAREEETFLGKTLLQLSEHMVCDRSAAQLQTQLRKLVNYPFNQIRTVEGTSQAGAEFMEFYPDAAALRKLVVELFYEAK